MSKSLIKKLLREVLLKENWLGNQMRPVFDGKLVIDNQHHDAMIVAEDTNNPTQHYLVLNVKLLPNINSFDYTYAFSIHNENLKLKGGFMYERAEVNKWLPQELNNKIMPFVINMTKDLVNKNKPKRITRKAMENLEGNSLIRYQKITDVLIDLGYKLQEGYPRKDSTGKLEWIFIDDSNKEHNLNEETILDYDFFDNEKRIARFNKSMNESWDNFIKKA